MCTLAVYFRCSTTVPLIVAANRDEYYARPTSSPRILAHDPWIVAGQDISAGGTWLGVNEQRLVVGVLNRHTAQGPDPSKRSRGLLCLEALHSGASVDVCARLATEDPATYNAFNMLIATPDAAYVAANDGTAISVTQLEPGVHVLTNLNLNDPTCPRIAASHRLFEAVPPEVSGEDFAPLLKALRAVLSDHRVPLDTRIFSQAEALCVHSPIYGTRSSTILAYSAQARHMRYWHAPGAPCMTDYAEVTLPS